MSTLTTTTNLPEVLQTVYSKEIFYAAMPVLKFAQFAQEKTELGKTPGQTIQFTKYSDLAGGGALTEGVQMTYDALAATTVSITVAEQGKATAVSEYLLQTATHDVLSEAAKLLGRNMAKVLDTQLQTAVINGAGNTRYADNVADMASLTAANTFDTDLIKDAVEDLESADAPKFNGDFYICFAHPHQLRSLRDDPDWISASSYGAPGQLFTGEVGRYEDVRFVSTTMMTTVQSTVLVYEAVMFGDYCLAWAQGLPVELRDNGVTDFGREHALAWYAIWGTGLIEANNAVLMESA